MPGDVTISGAGAWAVLIASVLVLGLIVTIALVSLVVVPRNHQFVGTRPNNGPGAKWTSRYAFVGVMSFGQPFVSDGMNEKGLAGGALYFSYRQGRADGIAHMSEMVRINCDMDHPLNSAGAEKCHQTYSFDVEAALAKVRKSQN